LEIIKDLNALPNTYLLDKSVATVNGVLAVDPDLTTRANLLGAAVPNPFRNVAGFEGTSLFTSTTISRQTLLRPFPQFGTSAVLTSNNDGKSWYHSGQFSLQKRFTKGNTI